ncbi:hypothetical protein VaNZ11_008724, partial [Volvox africanus]
TTAASNRASGTQALLTQNSMNGHHAVRSAGTAAASAAVEEPATVAAAKSAARTAAFGQVLRSKGFAWVSGRDAHVGEWSSAGNLMRFGTGGPWYDVLPREAWPSEPDKVAAIEKDFLPGIGDRRQELVFIGIDMLRDQLVEQLEKCLATPAEEVELKKLAAAAAAAAAAADAEAEATDSAPGKKALRAPCVLDPFLSWPDIRDIMDAGDDDDNDDGEEVEEEEDVVEEQDEEEEEVAEDEVEEDADEESEGKSDDEHPSTGHGPVGRWEPGVVLEDISDGAAELQALLDGTEQPAVLVLWHAPWAAASREAEAWFAALAARHPQLVFVRLDVTASQANEVLAISGCRLMALPASRRRDARPTLRCGAKWPAVTLHRPPGLQHEAYFTGATALAELRSELLRRQPEWEGAPRTVPASAAGNTDRDSNSRISSSTVIQQPTAAVSTTGGGGGGGCNDVPLLRWPTTDPIPATPAKPTVSVSVVTVPTAATASPSSSSVSSVQQRQLQLQPRVSELRRGAADLKAHLQEARDAGCPLVVMWLGAPPPNYPSTPTTSVPSTAGGGSAVATTTLSTPPPAAAHGAAVQHHPVPRLPSRSQQDGAVLELLELSEQEQAALRVDVAAACKQYGAAVRVLFADPGASATNRALAEALRVAAAPTLQVYVDMKMAKSFKGVAAVSKLAATLLEVAAPLPLLVPTPSAASAMTSQSVEMSPCSSLPGGSTGASELSLPPQARSSIYDPPSGKYGKPGARKQFGPRGRGVFWPRMPCLRCGCPWWLGEDWDAECVRCGWDCEADGYDDDSNPLPAFKAKYDTFTAALREGRTPVWRGKHVGPRS